jgi:ADP-ribose pyrophosphatase YjhB (NUDIX family)
MTGTSKNSSSDKNQWLIWAQEIQAIAQNGLTFAQSPFDTERYSALAAISAQMMAQSSEIDFPQIMEYFSQEKGYATPKIDVRGAVFKDHKVLLVKERSDQRWTLPGGWADVNYSPAYCMQKEVKEESGFDVNVIKLVALYDKLKHAHPLQWPHTYKCFFLCEIVGGDATTSIETSDVGFFELNQLPELSIHRVTQAQIEKCYHHYQNQTLPTEFD